MKRGSCGTDKEEDNFKAGGSSLLPSESQKLPNTLLAPATFADTQIHADTHPNVDDRISFLPVDL